MWVNSTEVEKKKRADKGGELDSHYGRGRGSLIRLEGKTANELDAGVFATKPKPKLQKGPRNEGVPQFFLRTTSGNASVTVKSKQGKTIESCWCIGIVHMEG